MFDVVNQILGGGRSVDPFCIPSLRRASASLDEGTVPTSVQTFLVVDAASTRTSRRRIGTNGQVATLRTSERCDIHFHFVMALCPYSHRVIIVLIFGPVG